LDSFEWQQMRYVARSAFDSGPLKISRRKWLIEKSSITAAWSDWL